MEKDDYYNLWMKAKDDWNKNMTGYVNYKGVWTYNFAPVHNCWIYVKSDNFKEFSPEPNNISKDE